MVDSMVVKNFVHPCLGGHEGGVSANYFFSLCPNLVVGQIQIQGVAVGLSDILRRVHVDFHRVVFWVREIN